jgi:hypothetical protein
MKFADRWKLYNPKLSASLFLKRWLKFQPNQFILPFIILAELTPERYQEIFDSMFFDSMFNEWLASELNYMLHTSS